MDSLDELKKEALAILQGAMSAGALRDAEIAYVGRSGKLTQVLKSLKGLSEGERHAMGAQANELRKLLELVIAERHAELRREDYEQKLERERIDVTRPGVKHRNGGLHPLTIIRRDIERIFWSMGFAVAEGPEIETEFYNFDALNIPADHPARDMWDTFWIKNEKRASKGQRLLLRTHTSPVQVRYMQTHNPPFRIIVPGRAFRYEATDATHEIQFYQLEGLMVGRDVSAANLKQVMQAFLGKLFGKNMKIRLRPSYFPFVEPGFEFDMSCVFCDGVGCSVCKHAGWIEMGGAGMVHPTVFEAAGLIAKDWQGFAFGMGIDRLAMMKYRIPDVRLFYQNDIRFLRQF